MDDEKRMVEALRIMSGCVRLDNFDRDFLLALVFSKGAIQIMIDDIGYLPVVSGTKLNSCVLKKLRDPLTAQEVLAFDEKSSEAMTRPLSGHAGKNIALQ